VSKHANEIRFLVLRNSAILSVGSKYSTRDLVCGCNYRAWPA